ncbi:m7GpppN-mRNA hydrolase-like [Oppia nitens]|uniref:m7GpppN-mRNA hydrolase-like n=1 Tax=Oppia nitens TaxID=1686743 RepID=UPI0023DBD4A4|nr:m7GpppN-mRNA hydrolase-like [Oppia nitens]
MVDTFNTNTTDGGGGGGGNGGHLCDVHKKQQQHLQPHHHHQHQQHYHQQQQQQQRVTTLPKTTATSMASSQQPSGIPIEILDDLAARFIINIPQRERDDLIRLCFLIEQAHWHYLDFICPQHQLIRHNYTRFTEIMFNHIPFLNQHIGRLAIIVSKWKDYKLLVPTCGAILLDPTLSRVLLVQGYGGRSWGFPKGKINENEPYVQCAAREVKEETGYDATAGISDQCYIERRINESSVRLYIAKDVDPMFAFKPLARNEIKEIRWFAVDELPVRTHLPTTTAAGSIGSITNSVVVAGNTVNANQFYSVVPFVKALRRWIARERQQRKEREADDHWAMTTATAPT